VEFGEAQFTLIFGIFPSPVPAQTFDSLPTGHTFARGRLVGFDDSPAGLTARFSTFETAFLFRALLVAPVPGVDSSDESEN
jgi:hypothetical protein